jgi:hypothetical protein
MVFEEVENDFGDEEALKTFEYDTNNASIIESFSLHGV